MYSVYILQSLKDRGYYVGSSANINERLLRHNAGRNKSTKSSIPWEVIHKELFQTKQEAYKRELEIKSYKGGRAFKKLVKK